MVVGGEPCRQPRTNHMVAHPILEQYPILVVQEGYCPYDDFHSDPWEFVERMKNVLVAS